MMGDFMYPNHQNDDIHTYFDIYLKSMEQN